MDYLFPFELIEKGKNIIIYGAGNVGKSFYTQCKFSNYCNIVLWVDKNYEKYLPFGYKVEKVQQEYKNIEYDYVVIAIEDGAVEKKIREFLILEGIPNDCIVWKNPRIEVSIGDLKKGPDDWEAIQSELGLEQKMWRKRTIALRSFIDENDHSVMDLGAGNMYMEGILSEHVRYIPVDYVKRCEKTVVCDFNKYEFPECNADVAVCAGILSYINDVEWFFDKLCQSVKKIVISYKSKSMVPENLYYVDEIITMLNKRGFILTGWNREYEDVWSLLGCFKKVAPDLLRENFYCSGCGTCRAVCPNNAIYLKLDTDGFLKPEVDSNLCCECQKCINTCPAIICDSKNSDEPECFALWASDEIRKDSSSGGAFSVFADYILEQKGIVFGAVWDDKFDVIHIGIESPEELCRLRHSKYVQSDTLNTFEQVQKYVNEGKKVLYVGTPCQIAGLKNYIDDKEDNLYTIDLVCASITSISSFRKYLEENFEVDQVKNIVFRDKYKGWCPDGYTVWKKNGDVIELNINTDSFQNAFHDGYFRNETCTYCKYAEFPRHGDLTIGDFWGIHDLDPTWNDDLGTSCLMINSEKGRKMFDSVRNEWKKYERVPFDWPQQLNRLGKGKEYRPHAASRFFELMRNGARFNDAVAISKNNKFDIGIIVRNSSEYGYNLSLYALSRMLQDSSFNVCLIIVHDQMGKNNPDNMLENYGHIPYEKYMIKHVEDIEQLKTMDVRCNQYIHYVDKFDLRNNTAVYDYYDIFKEKFICIYPTEYGTKKGEIFLQELIQCGCRLQMTQDPDIRIGITSDKLVDTLNPILLCKKEYFSKMCSMGEMRLSDVYAACYLEKFDKNKMEQLNVLANSEEMQINLIFNESDCDTENIRKSINIMPNCLMEEWIANFVNSQYVITDSYYGVCMALLYDKPVHILDSKVIELINSNSNIPFEILTEDLEKYRNKLTSYFKKLK